jgi:hypothetical protein
VTGKCKSVNRSFVLFLPSLGSNSVPKYLSRKAKKNLTFGFSFVGPEERTQTLIGAGFQSGSTEQVANLRSHRHPYWQDSYSRALHGQRQMNSGITRDDMKFNLRNYRV